MHPILFEYGKIHIFSYGMMMVIGYLAALLFYYSYAPRIKMDKSDAVDLSICVFLSGIVGARLIYVIFNLGFYSQNWLGIFEVQKGGLAWHGGILGGLLAAYLFARAKKYSIGGTLDLIFTGSAIGLAFGRIGCFLNGCCYGKPCSFPWAVTFPYHLHPEPVHPTQIYEMILDVLLFLFLVYWWKKRKFDGENALMMVSIYSIIRFAVEFFRHTSPSQMVMGLSYAQWASIVITLVFSILILILRAKKPETIEESEEIGESESAGQT